MSSAQGDVPLSAEEQAFLHAFLRLPPHVLMQYVRVLQHWAEAPGARKAIALKLLNAGLSAKDVARLCGLSDRQLRRYPEYRAFSQLLREGNAPPRGIKQTEGSVDAWDEED